MTSQPSRPTRVVLLAAPISALLLLAGCGGSADPAPAPRPTPTPTEPATPTPTPTATQAAARLSPFEDRAEVQVLRRWAAAAAVDITNGDAALPRSSAFVTKGSRQELADVVGGDVGKTYPGPIPFTPVGVQARGKQTRVFACLQVAGWGLDKKGRPAERREVDGVRFELTRSHGRWLVDHLYSSDSTRCKGVTVTGVKS
ncbi:hypothetical protein [Nocardioides sp. CER19]|uniref:hypothetical protein n=1 Tax=Nocardioides sp. CER19 TaxID=3038538 RepID=UPI002447C413|nr:hypothetical protein [Nocardioides sp. CER19]MDH2413240.1 hypothetical protein [Nocardioides sp. CER19]